VPVPGEASIGDVFPANDPAAQWVAVLCIAFNDLTTVDAQIHVALKAENMPRAGQYVRWFCGFLHEMALHIRNGRKQQKVAGLLGQLDAQAVADEQRITRLESELGPVRKVSFHYPKVSSETIAKGLGAVANRPAVHTVDHEAGTLRVTFADTIAEGVAFGDVEADAESYTTQLQGVVEAVEVISRYVTAVLRVYQRPRGLSIVGDP
jgi:hypothetical protein